MRVMKAIQLISAIATATMLPFSAEAIQASDSCVVTTKQFCVGEVAKHYQIALVEQPHAGRLVEGFTYAVKGVDRQNSKVHFVALVRNADAPGLNNTNDRLVLCQMLGIEPSDCASPVRMATQTYQVLYEGHPYPVNRGVRIDLLSTTGVSKTVADSLAFPCATLEDGSKRCGPNLGTCIRRRNSVGCDFRENFWNSVWKWRWRHHLGA